VGGWEERHGISKAKADCCIEKEKEGGREGRREGGRKG
jgi:hypothetical protein